MRATDDADGHGFDSLQAGVDSLGVGVGLRLRAPSHRGRRSLRVLDQLGEEEPWSVILDVDILT